MRFTLAVAVACLMIGGISAADRATAAIRKSTEIPAQGLGPALTSLAKEFDFQVLYRTEVVGTLRTQGVSGAMTAAEALEHVLSGTGLTYKYLDDKTVTILPVGAAAPSSNSDGGHEPVQGDDAEKGNQSPGGDRKKSFWDHFRLAQAAPSSNSGLSSQPSTPKSAQLDTVPTGPEVRQQQEQPKLEEIIVTAEKRSENLLEVPMAISVVSSERLAQLQVNSLVDLDSFVPGLTIASAGAPGLQTIVLRGLSSGAGQAGGPTVATYIDELPVSGITSTERSGTSGIDLQPYDVAQVEVLKGPQGTLYGSSTLAGLIKYRLIEPDLRRVDIVAGTSTEYIDSSGKPGWSVHGAVSLPLVTDTLAVRLSGFKKDVAGYIDNVQLGLNNVNSLSESGGIGSVLWRPIEALTVKATVLAQDQNMPNWAGTDVDPNTQQPIFGWLKEATHFLQPTWNQVRNSALTVNWDVGFATLTSATGYSSFRDEQTFDYSSLGIYCSPTAFPGNTGCPNYPYPNALVKWFNWDRVYRFTQEMRLASPENQRIQWIIGGYYTREKGGEVEYLPSFTPSGQQLPSPQNDIIDGPVFSQVLSEVAAFGNLTFKITDRWDITAGERYSRYRISDNLSQQAGVLGGCGLADNGLCPLIVIPGGSAGVNVWMGNIRFHLSDDTLLYVRASTGYQPGFFYAPLTPAQSGVVRPSKTTNYEVGFKGRFLDGRLELDAAGFYIDWKDIQFDELTSQGLQYPTNGGTARSTGAELTTIYELIKGLRFTGTLAYTDARLTEDVFSSPGVIQGNNGDQLLQAPLWTSSVSLDYQGPLTQDLSLLSGVSYLYRDKVDNQFAGSGQPYEQGPQNKVNFYTGIGVRNLTVKLYATNVTNDRAYSGVSYGANYTSYVPIQPRTIGISADYKFGR